MQSVYLTFPRRERWTNSSIFLQILCRDNSKKEDFILYIILLLIDFFISTKKKQQGITVSAATKIANRLVISKKANLSRIVALIFFVRVVSRERCFPLKFVKNPSFGKRRFWIENILAVGFLHERCVQCILPSRRQS